MTTGAEWDIQWQCQCVFLRFMQHLDDGRCEEALALLAPHAVWHRQGDLLVGHDAVREAIGRRPQNRLIRHHLSNIVVTVNDPNRASSKAYYVVYMQDGAGLPRTVRGPERAGDYGAEYVKIDGQWIISSLRASRLFVTSVDS
jgi:hypothetical protein